MLSLLALVAFAGPPRAALSTTAVMPRTVIKPGDPIEIYLAMENRTDETLWFETHTTSPCFMNKFVDIEASPPIEKKPLDGTCEVPSSKVKPGGVVWRLVDLREVYVMPEQTYSYLTIAWKDGGPDIYSPLTQRIGPVKFAEPLIEERIQKGGELYLPNKHTLVWNAHESAPGVKKGDAPQLVLDVLLRMPGEGESPRKVTVPIERKKQFQLDGYVFEIRDHQFDQWMDLRIFPL